VGLRGQDASLRLSGSWHQVDAFDLDTSDAATQGSALRSWDAGMRGGWAPGGDVDLELRADYLRRDLEGIDSNAAGGVFDRKNRVENATAHLKSSFWRGQDTNASASVSYSWYRDQFLYDQRGATAQDSVQVSTDQQVQLNLQLNQLWGDHHLTVATEGLVEHQETPRLEDDSARRVRGALMLQDQWALAPSLDLVLGTRADADSSFGAFLSPSLATRWQPHQDWVLRATAGRGFRAPDFREQWLLFENPSANYRVQGNPDLDPERAISLGLHTQWTPHRRVNLDLSLFRNDIEDLITTDAVRAGDANSAALFSYVNVSRAWTQGAESHLRLTPWAGASAELSYALTQTRDVARDRPLPGRALHRVGWRLAQSYRPWGLEGSLQGSWNGQRLFFEDPDGDGQEQRVPVDPYVTLDARVAWQVTPWLSLFSGGENLLNAGQAPWLPLRPRRLYAGATGRY
jgi:outer membrane receptor for ferrienterochelin and colicins